MLFRSLLALPKQKVLLGKIAAAFFICVVPGNIAQYIDRRDASGLNTDQKRLGRLFFQPILVAWSLWSTSPIRGSSRTVNSERASHLDGKIARA